MRINKLEVRKSSSNSYELVEWVENSEGSAFCYTILSWLNSKEQPDIKFVGNRPFEVDDKETLWKLMKYGQAIIQAEYDLKD